MPFRLGVGFCVAILATAAAAEETPQFRVVGYLPEYRLPDFAAERAAGLTDLIFFSVLPAPNGEFRAPALDDPATKKLLGEIRRRKIRVHLCVGGWDRSQNFAEVAAMPQSRQEFAAGALTFCARHDFAGIDLDWEHPADEAQQENYGLLLEALARVFHAEHKEVSLAMAGWQQLSGKAFAAVDGINLMSYDGPERHSTFEQAVKEVGDLKQREAAAKKIRLGVPFYGRGIANREQVLTYGQIVERHRLKADVNEVEGLFFNGPDLIRKKTAWAKGQKLGGVMIWEIGQDTHGEKSLLKVIRKAAQ